MNISFDLSLIFKLYRERGNVLKEVGKEVGGNNFYKSEISRNYMGALLVSLSRE